MIYTIYSSRSYITKRIIQIQRNTYISHTTHSYLLSRVGYVRLQGQKDSDTTIVYISYENDLGCILDLFPSVESLYIQTMSIH